MTTLATIGYEGASIADFIGTLHHAGIKQVIDIRDVPASRRPGFSKNVLAEALRQEKIGYIHLKALGDPKAGRDAAREGRFDDFRAIFNARLALPESQEALKVAVDQAKETPSTLLCYERDCKHCHRSIVAKSMAVFFPFKVQHLGVHKMRRSHADWRESKEAYGAVAIASG